MAVGSPNDYVQFTNDEATATKAHSIRRGYWNDPYMKYFCSTPSPTTPEISRGYFVRVQVFEAMVRRFIKDFEGNCQIVNFGAGSDTLFFRLSNLQCLPRIFVEIDLPTNVRKKIYAIKRCKDLQLMINAENPLPGNFFELDNRLSSNNYHLFSFDLRRSSNDLINELCTLQNGPHLSTILPTLFLAECVLVYIPTVSSNDLLSVLSHNFTNAAFLNYEQVNMNDRFGEIMIRSFRDRSCDLPGLSACGSLDDQKKRFRSVGWSEVHAWTINEVYNSLPPAAAKRVEKIELLDDREITKQLYDHYCILLAMNTRSVCNWSTLTAALEDVK